MEALDVVVADPVVVAVHVVALALSMPFDRPVVVLAQVANLVEGEEAGRLGKVARSAVLERSGSQSGVLLVLQVESSPESRQAEDELVRWTAVLEPANESIGTDESTQLWFEHCNYAKPTSS